MFAHPVSVRLYLDNVFAAALLSMGTATCLCAAFHVVPTSMGLVGICLFGYGKILCIGSMLRQMSSREIAAFEHGKEYARVTQLH